MTLVPRWQRVVLTCSAFVFLASQLPAGQQRALVSPELVAALPPPLEPPPFVCGTADVLAVQLGFRAATALTDNDGLSVKQFPDILTADQQQDIRVVVEFVGDLTTLNFRRTDLSQDASFTLETWDRTTARTVAGQLVSVFDRTYSASMLFDMLRFNHGYDFPMVPLGHIEIPGTAMPNPDGTLGDPDTFLIYLRIAPTNLPPSTVRTINVSPVVGAVQLQGVQYASNVVNLAIGKKLADEQITRGEKQFNVEAVAELFYQHFADVYHTLAIVPEAAPLGSYGGFNQNVIQDIQGLGLPQLNRSSLYGSTMLRSNQVFTQAHVGTNSSFSHELVHHWAFYAELPQNPAGHDPEGHFPLATLPSATHTETIVGAALRATVQVVAPTSATLATVHGGQYHIARTPIPIQIHSLVLYLMGLSGVTEVPDLLVFEDQGQFDPDTSTAPDPGTAVTGNTQTFTINDVMGKLGPRQGPVFNDWRTAIVIVSENPISQKAMDFWNFWAKRLAATSGVTSYNGHPSFHEMSQRKITIRTDIDPKDQVANPKINQNLTVAHPPFGTKDWRGLIFDQPVPSRFNTNQTVTLSASVDTSILTQTFVVAIVRFTRYGDEDNAITLQASVDNGRLSVDVTFTDDQLGMWSMDAFLFEGFGVPPSASVGVQTPITVEKP